MFCASSALAGDTDLNNLRASKRDRLLSQTPSVKENVPLQATGLMKSVNFFERLGYPKDVAQKFARKVNERDFLGKEKIANRTHVAAAIIENGTLYEGSRLEWDTDESVLCEYYVEGGYRLLHVIGQDIWFRPHESQFAERVTEPSSLAKNETASAVIAGESSGKAETTVEANSAPEEIQAGSDTATDKKGWGSFAEKSIWTGAWINPSKDTGGVWFEGKYLRWYTQYENPENFAIGAKVKADYGKILKNGNADWGYLAAGPAVGYYRGLGLRNSFETDVALMYRFDKNRPNGLMPTVHAEFSRVLDYKNRLTFQVDGSYFPKDSWLGPGLYWERKLDKDWKVIIGAGASLGWLDGDFISGFQPSIRFRYKNRWNVGVNANLFTGLGTFYGIVFAYELTPDINTWYETSKAKTVKLKQKGTSDEVVSEKKVEAPEESKANPQGIRISVKTINEMEREERR